MNERVQHLIDLHHTLIEAMAAGDADRFLALLADREHALRRLKAAYDDADDATRAAMQPGLATLQHLDSDLQERVREARDRLGADLRRGAAPRPASRPTVTGVFDRQA